MKRFKQILCVVEDGKGDQIALERAVTLAENNHANLTVVTITPCVTAGIGMPDNSSMVSTLV